MSLIVPNVFATLAGNQPAALLDADFNAVVAWINARNPAAGAIAGRPAFGNAGALWASTDAGGKGLWLDIGSAWLSTLPASGMANVKDFGAVGDGVADDTAAVQLAVNSVSALWFPPGTYLMGQVSVPTSCLYLGGTWASVLKQKVAGANVLSVVNSPKLRIDGLQFLGVGGTTSESSNAGVFASVCSSLSIESCLFSGFRWKGAWIEGGGNVRFVNNEAFNSASALQLRGVNGALVANNLFRDPSTPTSTFTTGISLDSTDGHSFGICTNVRVVGNEFRNWINAQSILAHAGVNVVFGANVITNTEMGISVNQFNGTDTISDLAIVDNVCIGTSTTFVGPTGGSGIQVSGLNAGSLALNVTITGNTVRHFNAIFQDQGTAAIQTQYSGNVTIANNGVFDSFANGISVGPNGGHTVIEGNDVDIVTTAGGQCVGIRVTGTSGEHLITGNKVNGANDAVRVDSALGNACVVRNNKYSTIAVNVFAGASNAVFEGKGVYTSGATTIDVGLGAVRHLRVANSSPTTIPSSSIVNAIPGQELILSFDDANTTIDRSGALLAGSVNFVSAANAVLRLIYRDSVWEEVSRVMNNG